MPNRKNVVLLGATGSVGESTLAVIRRHPERFRLVGIAANRNGAALGKIASEFGVAHAHLYERDGLQALIDLATLPEADIVIVATTGTIGVRPTIAALEAGKRVGLANKETLVLAGQFVMAAAKSAPGQLLPVDSEHNAIFQCLDGRPERPGLKRILLTASGGPFLNHTQAELENVTVDEALRHPNWDMGSKITIDSATLANKGLEMIEARWLFDLRPEQITVVVHPQSYIHSMVEFLDGSVIAQLAPPSMTFPIQHVLAYPERLEPCGPSLDFDRILRLDLRPPDLDKFRCLHLARRSLERGGLSPAVYNAANSAAAEAFSQNKLPFLAIPRVIEHCMEKAAFGVPGSLDDLLQLEPEIEHFTAAQLKRFLN